jgi:hypothetical protein
VFASTKIRPPGREPFFYRPAAQRAVESGMRKLLKRWYVWLGLLFLLGFAASATVVYGNPSRVNQANFDRIEDGMTLDQVKAILGEDEAGDVPTTFAAWWLRARRWEHGPNWITVRFLNGRAKEKNLHLATAWETLQWYAKKGAEKIGVKWD